MVMTVTGSTINFDSRVLNDPAGSAYTQAGHVVAMAKYLGGGTSYNLNLGFSSFSNGGAGIHNFNFSSYTLGGKYYCVGCTAEETVGGTNTSVASISDNTLLAASSFQLVTEDADGAYITPPVIHIVVVY